MADKAKFDREAAFKSIIGAGRQSENAAVAVSYTHLDVYKRQPLAREKKKR